MTVAILGAGAFGTALAVTLGKKATKVVLWSRTKEHAVQLNIDMENKRHLKGIKFSNNIVSTHDLKFACEQVDAVLICIPAQQINTFFNENFSFLPKEPLIICSKGIDAKTSLLQTDIIKKYSPDSTLAVLTGPSFASEIAVGLPTALTLACEDSEACFTMQKLLSNPTLRIYTSADIISAQLGGALKNVVAIACGMVMSASLGENARISVMTRGFNEIIKLGIAMGGNQKTFYGLSGLGDLCLTCNSMLSRNFLLGFNFNSNKTLHKKITVEGVETARAAVSLMKTYRIDAPVISSVHKILTKNISVAIAMEELLSRPLKEELI